MIAFLACVGALVLMVAAAWVPWCRPSWRRWLRRTFGTVEEAAEVDHCERVGEYDSPGKRPFEEEDA